MIKYKIRQRYNIDYVLFQIIEQPEDFSTVLKLSYSFTHSLFPNLVVLSQSHPSFIPRTHAQSILYIRGFNHYNHLDWIEIPIQNIYMVISALNTLNDIYLYRTDGDM